MNNTEGNAGKESAGNSSEGGNAGNESGTSSLASGSGSIADYAFHNCTALAEAEFTGDAPDMNVAAFLNAKSVFYYDSTGSGWNEVLKNFGRTNICMVEKGTCSRAVALLLDCSGSMMGEPLAALKEAAAEFCSRVLSAEAATQIVVIQYQSNAYSYGFTSDLSGLQSKISGLAADDSTDLYSAIEKADRYLQAISAAEKNIVIMTDALPQNGTSSESGPYTSADHSSYYKYANAVCNRCGALDTSYRIFTMGFFHSLEGAELIFAADLLDRIDTSGYYQVTEIEKLLDAFQSVAGAMVDPEEAETEKPTETEQSAEKETAIAPVGKKQTITLKSASLTVSVGKTKSINASAKTKLTYTSSNNSVVKVTSKGKVKGLKPGKAVITIKAAASAKYAGAEKKITVTVAAVKNKTYKVGSYKYKVTNASANGKGTVTLTSAAKAKMTKIVVPNTVKIGVITYQVTAIGANAFAKNTSLKEATIGKNVKKIGAKAFYGCKKLTKMTISSSKITSVGSSAFKGVSSKAKIKVPSKKKAAYKKLFRKRGLPSKVKVY